MLFCRSCTRAEVTEDALLVRVKGKAPRLWRAPLAELTHATLSVQPVTEGGKTTHSLLINKNGATDEIARFETAKDAERAFVIVSDRLMDGQRSVRSGKRPLIVRLFLVLFKVVLWFLFLLMLAVIAVQFFIGPRQAVVAPAGTAERPAVQAPASGVPLPADSFFGE